MSDSESSRESQSQNSPNDSYNDQDSNSNASLGVNVYANDGSFMEQFKRRMEEASKQSQTYSPSNTDETNHNELPSSSIKAEKTEEEQKKPFYSLVGKRRGGKILKTGMVKKQKTQEPEDDPKDAWSRYMSEVRAYQKQSCSEDEKTRPLVK